MTKSQVKRYGYEEVIDTGFHSYGTLYGCLSRWNRTEMQLEEKKLMKTKKWWWKTWQAAAFPRFLASIVNILARLFTHYSRTVVYRPFPSFSAPYARYGSWWEIREGNGIRREWDEWVNEWEKHVVRSVQSRRLSSYSLRIPSQPCLSSHPFLSSFHPYGARFVSFLRLTFTP